MKATSATNLHKWKASRAKTARRTTTRWQPNHISTWGPRHEKSCIMYVSMIERFVSDSSHTFTTCTMEIFASWLLLALFVPLASPLYFHIAETERKCFIEEIPDETMVTGNYKVQLYDPRSVFSCINWYLSISSRIIDS
jgi:hypothetical protein